MPVVRPWRPADRLAVLALNAELQDHERALRPSRLPGAEMTEAYVAGLESRLVGGSDAGALYVAEDGEGSVIGLVACFVDKDALEVEPAEVVMEDLVVAAGLRRRGVGRALVEVALGFARERRVRRVVVSALVVNEDALATYRALGFRPLYTRLERESG